MGVGVDVKHVMGFFVWMLYTCFLWIYCKEHMICEKKKKLTLGFMSSYWEFGDFEE